MSVALVKVVKEIIALAKRTEEFEQSDTFYLKVKNSGYMDLVIESWKDDWGVSKRVISVAHYTKINGDLVSDPDIEMTEHGMPISLTQIMGYTVCSIQEGGKIKVNTKAKSSVESFCTMWAKNIKNQGFLDAVRKGDFLNEA